MAASDLAVLPDVKAWLQAGTPSFGTADDATLSRTITAISGMIYGYLSRQIIIPKSVTERYDGVGNPRILLRNYPVLSVASVIVDGVTIGPGTYPTASVSAGWPPSGYIFSAWDGGCPGKPQVLDAFSNPSSVVTRTGYSYPFCAGRQNVQVQYLCGYAVPNEPAVVPTSGPFTVQVLAPLGPWASDMGIAYASTGVALTAVASSPAQGQYVPPTPGAMTEGQAPSYVFAAADAGASVLITYGFVPAALNDACIEWAAERYRYRGRIGQRAQTVSGQQTASYDTSGVPSFVKVLLDPYRNVVPSMAWY